MIENKRLIDKRLSVRMLGILPSERGEELPALLCQPQAGAARLRVDLNAERLAVRLDQVAGAPAPVFSQFIGVARREDGVVWMLTEKPAREQHRGVGALRRARRHQHHQPIDVAAGQRLELVAEKVMVDRRFVAAEAAPFTQIAPARSAKVKLPARFLECLLTR